MKEFSFHSFDKEVGGKFGFNGCLISQVDTDHLYFKALLPEVKQTRDEPCEECQGSGESELFNRECLRCDGGKKKIEYVFDLAFATSASLNFLLGLFSFPEVPSTSRAPQMMTLNLLTQHGMHGGSLSGCYGILLVEWLVQHRKQEIQPMVQAMRKAHEKMLGTHKYSHIDRFRAVVDYDNGWLNVDCPGNACGIHPQHHGIREGQGYEFSCHNVDTPMQQLTLVAGLAALHDVVDKDYFIT